MESPTDLRWLSQLLTPQAGRLGWSAACLSSRGFNKADWRLPLRDCGGEGVEGLQYPHAFSIDSGDPLPRKSEPKSSDPIGLVGPSWMRSEQLLGPWCRQLCVYI